jgi:hypothetical protein
VARPPTGADELFWDCAAQLFDNPEIHESTMFGFRCIRWRNEFVAMPAQDRLWVKLPAERVHELIESGGGEECAPNGRRFREWVKIAGLDEPRWLSLMTESVEFAGRPKRKRT